MGDCLRVERAPSCTGKVLALIFMLTATGIQYKAQTKNCDLIVQSCDFHGTFNSDSEWLAESRTCFASTTTKGLRDTFTHHFIARF